MRVTNHNGSGLAGTDQERTVTHLLTSSPPGPSPAVFLRSGSGAVPNTVVWGPCLGGQVTPATRECPVVPIEGPKTWNGDDYLSLGALLPGESRELRLSPALKVGRTLSLWCRLHPALRVDLTVGGAGRDASAPAIDAAQARARAAALPRRAAEVLVAPVLPDPVAEVLDFVPRRTSVRVGEAVTWSLDSPSPHTVEFGAGEDLGLNDSVAADAAASPGREWDGQGRYSSGFLSSDNGAPGGTRFSLRFTRPGRYAFRCRFHPLMTGEVVVAR